MSNDEPRRLDETQRRDLDETRRLLYMALFRPESRWHNLAGTLANALVHHGLKQDPDEVMGHIRALCSSAEAEASEEWARHLIDRITLRLERKRPPLTAP